MASGWAPTNSATGAPSRDPVLYREVTERIRDAEVDIVWDPPWNQGMLSEAARLQLGLF